MGIFSKFVHHRVLVRRCSRHLLGVFVSPHSSERCYLGVALICMFTQVVFTIRSLDGSHFVT